MFGLIASLGAGLLNLIHNDQSKTLRGKLNTTTTGLATSVCFAIISTLVLAGFYLFGPQMTVKAPFYLNAVLAAAILTTAALSFLKGIKDVPLSRALPLLAVGPIITLLISGSVSTTETLGVIAVAVAMALFRIEPQRDRSRLLHQGQLYILLTGVLFGLTPIFDAQAVANSSPVLYSAIAGWLRLLLFLLAFAVMGRTSKESKSDPVKPLLPIVSLVATLQVVEWLLQMSALTVLPPPVVVAIKEAVIILGALLYGGFFRHEKITVWAIAGALLAACGIILVRLT